jgi:hypothetical protein
VTRYGVIKHTCRTARSSSPASTEMRGDGTERSAHACTRMVEPSWPDGERHQRQSGKCGRPAAQREACHVPLHSTFRVPYTVLYCIYGTGKEMRPSRQGWIPPACALSQAGPVMVASIPRRPPHQARGVAPPAVAARPCSDANPPASSSLSMHGDVNLQRRTSPYVGSEDTLLVQPCTLEMFHPTLPNLC